MDVLRFFGQGGYDHFDITSDPNEAKIIITDLTTNKVVIDTKTTLEIDLKNIMAIFLVNLIKF